MIRETLEALDAHASKEVLRGLDASGAQAWRCTGADVLRAVGGWQARLRELGVRAGDRVAIDVPRGPDLLPTHLAALASGACVVPLNPALTAAERARVLQRAEPAALLDAAERPGAPAVPRLAGRDLERPALLMFTSGTTGDPKGVPLSLSNLESNLDGLAATWELREGDRLLHALPAHHVHGLVLALYGAARLAMAIVMHPRFDADRCLESLERDGVTVFMGVPTMYHRMVRAAREPSLRGMRAFISGSAPLAPRDFADFEARFGHAPVERYGLTETMIVTSNPLRGDRRPGTVGLPLPDTEVRLAADGEIEVRGPGVMSGYWRDPAASAAAFDGGFFRTGDLGRRDAAGYLCISGRKKELIIVGGTNVLPGEVERALGEESGVEELAAAGLPDPDRGEVVVAWVVPGPAEDHAALESRLRARAEAELAPYKRPRAYRFVGELPRNAMGKVDRRALVRT